MSCAASGPHGSHRSCSILASIPCAAPVTPSHAHPLPWPSKTVSVLPSRESRPSPRGGLVVGAAPRRPRPTPRPTGPGLRHAPPCRARARFPRPRRAPAATDERSHPVCGPCGLAVYRESATKQHAQHQTLPSPPAHTGAQDRASPKCMGLVHVGHLHVSLGHAKACSYRFIWPKPGPLGACLDEKRPENGQNATVFVRPNFN